jgi:hypothetical protein
MLLHDSNKAGHRVDAMLTRGVCSDAMASFIETVGPSLNESYTHYLKLSKLCQIALQIRTHGTLE